MIRLASRSATRRRMLEAVGVPFVLVDAAVDERAVVADDGLATALELAAAKALAADAPADALVLGADQVLALDDGSLLHKAESRAVAAAQLRRMSGRPHRLHSAAALARGGAVEWRGAESVVMQVRPLSDDFIAAYLDAEWEAVRHNVGCYGIEGRGAQLFERVEGSHFAVLGLPLLPLLAELRARGLLPA